MRSLARPLYLSLLPALLLTALPVHAALITYTDSVSFGAAATGLTNIGFSGPTPVDGSTNYNNSTGLSVGGVQFVGFEGGGLYDLAVVNPGPTSTFYDFGTGAGLRSPSYNAPPAGFLPYIHVVLPANVTAFSVDLMTLSPNALNYQVTVLGMNFNVPTATRPTRTFFGVTSDSPISFVDLAVTGTTRSGGTYGLIDNVQTGAEIPPTPEVATLLTIGTGLLGLGVFRKRLQRFNASAA